MDNCDLATIRRENVTAFANGCWCWDRYKDLEPLEPGREVIIADLAGPGIIRHIHSTQHPDLNQAGQARGIVLLIYFDDAPEPAVQCPLPDFFGHGCNGKGMFFSALYVECAPKSYNCYFPMPFRQRAKVVLRNDLDQRVINYSYVEYERLPRWEDRHGYFHATYRRQAFQLRGDTRATLFHVQGTGHLIGRQFSIASDEPLFHDFGYIMEGNNEVDIDGHVRVLDYLGTEDSFTFSWGFQNQFAGLRAGMPYIEKAETNALSIYRFHDHMPIRFNTALRWSIDWTYEFKTDWLAGLTEFVQRIDAAAQSGGCWVDYATVFYWYQDQPGGYTHDPLPDLAERIMGLLRPSRL